MAKKDHFWTLKIRNFSNLKTGFRYWTGLRNYGFRFRFCIPYVSVTPNTFSSGLSLTDHIARFTLQFRQLSQKIGTWWNELRFCVSKMSRKFLYSWLFYGDGSHDNDVHIFQWKILADWPRFTEQKFANICCRNKKKKKCKIGP